MVLPAPRNPDSSDTGVGGGATTDVAVVSAAKEAIVIIVTWCCQCALRGALLVCRGA